MTSSETTNWAREEAERISDQFGDYEWGYQPSGAKDLRLRLTAAIEAALLAVERKAKEECARIAQDYADNIAGLPASKLAAFNIRNRIKATLPLTSKAE